MSISCQGNSPTLPPFLVADELDPPFRQLSVAAAAAELDARMHITRQEKLVAVERWGKRVVGARKAMGKI